MLEDRKSSTTIVLEAVQDLHGKEQIVTRETLAELTGLTLSVIDDRIGTLVDRGDILRVHRGVYCRSYSTRRRAPCRRRSCRTAWSSWRSGTTCSCWRRTRTGCWRAQWRALRRSSLPSS